MGLSARTIGPISWLCMGLPLIAVSGGSAADSPAPDPKLAARTAAIKPRIDAELASLDELYKHLHSNPEISHQEAKTAARMAQELQKIGFEVTTGIGGHGLVGILKNGPGP